MTQVEQARGLTACPICAASGIFLKEEERTGHKYRSFRCTSCRSIWCPDHHASVSPDYVDRGSDDITPEVLWLQGEHKYPAFDQLFRVLSRRGHKVSSVLDIGCGTGGFLEYAKARGVPALYGFDAAGAQVSVARTVSEHVRQSVSLARYVRMLGCIPRWELITMWDVIEHLRKPENLLVELHGYCDADTLLLICTPNGVSEVIKLHARNLLSAAHSFIPWEHVLYYSLKGLRLILEKTGFETVYATGAVCYPRRVGTFEIIRRAGFAVSRRTPLAPQLFVLARKAAR